MVACLFHQGTELMMDVEYWLNYRIMLVIIKKVHAY